MSRGKENGESSIIRVGPASREGGLIITPAEDRRQRRIEKKTPETGMSDADIMEILAETLLFEQQDLPYIRMWMADPNIHPNERTAREVIVRRVEQVLRLLQEASYAVTLNNISAHDLITNTKFLAAKEQLDRLTKHGDLFVYLETKHHELLDTPETVDWSVLLPSESFDPSWYSEEDITAGSRNLADDLELYLVKTYNADERREFQPLIDFLHHPVGLGEDDTEEPKGAIGETRTLSYLQHGRPDVWRALTRLIHEDTSHEAFLAILGKQVTRVSGDEEPLAERWSDEASRQRERALYLRQGNILNIDLYHSAAALHSSVNPQLRMAEKEALTELYGRLPQELEYEASALTLNIELNALCENIQDEKTKEVIRSGLTLLVPTKTEMVSAVAISIIDKLKFWRPEPMDKRLSFDWDTFFASLDAVVASKEISNEQYDKVLYGLLKEVRRLLDRADVAVRPLPRSPMNDIGPDYSAFDEQQRAKLEEPLLCQQMHRLLKYLNTYTPNFPGVKDQFTLEDGSLLSSKVEILNMAYVSRVRKSDLLSRYEENPDQPWLRDFSGWQMNKMVFTDEHNLDEVDFSDAQLEDCSFNKTSMKEASMVGASMAGTRWTNVDMRTIEFGAAPQFPDAHFESVDMIGQSLQHANFSASEFYGAQVGNADFFAANFSDAKLHIMGGENVSFRGAHMVGAEFGRMVRSAPEESDQPTLPPYISERFDFAGADCRKMLIREVNFVEGSFQYVNFEGAVFDTVDLSTADMTGVNSKDMVIWTAPDEAALELAKKPKMDIGDAHPHTEIALTLARLGRYKEAEKLAIEKLSVEDILKIVDIFYEREVHAPNLITRAEYLAEHGAVHQRSADYCRLARFMKKSGAMDWEIEKYLQPAIAEARKIPDTAIKKFTDLGNILALHHELGRDPKPIEEAIDTLAEKHWPKKQKEVTDNFTVFAQRLGEYFGIANQLHEVGAPYERYLRRAWEAFLQYRGSEDFGDRVIDSVKEMSKHIISIYEREYEKNPEFIKGNSVLTSVFGFVDRSFFQKLELYPQEVVRFVEALVHTGQIVKANGSAKRLGETKGMAYESAQAYLALAHEQLVVNNESTDYRIESDNLLLETEWAVLNAKEAKRDTSQKYLNILISDIKLLYDIGRDPSVYLEEALATARFGSRENNVMLSRVAGALCYCGKHNEALLLTDEIKSGIMRSKALLDIAKDHYQKNESIAPVLERAMLDPMVVDKTRKEQPRIDAKALATIANLDAEARGRDLNKPKLLAATTEVE